MKTIITLATALALTGCADWSRETRIEETAYQVVSAADTVLAYQAQKVPSCYVESGWPTAGVIGQHPTPAAEFAWGLSRGVIHAAVTHILEREDANPWLKRTWQAGTLALEARVVRDQWSIGIRFGHATPPADAYCNFAPPPVHTPPPNCAANPTLCQ